MSIRYSVCRKCNKPLSTFGDGPLRIECEKGKCENSKGENMSNEQRMGLRVGDTIIHCDRVFTIVNINCEEHVDGMVLSIRAFDPDMASREQQKAINVEQTKDQMIAMIKKMTEGGGGNIGFGI